MVRKLALALASALVALAAVEIAVRTAGLGVRDYMSQQRKYGFVLVHDERGFTRHRAGTDIVLQGKAFRFNSFGMRDDEPRRPKPPGLFRILCIGDSVTLGQGVAQEAVYPAQLRTLLAPEHVDVVAAGVAGWNTAAEERFLAHHLDALEPDLVVLLYVINDNEVSEPFGREREPPSTWRTRIYRTLVLHSQLFEWAAFTYEARVARPDAEGLSRMAAWWQRQKEATGGAPFTAGDRGWIESRDALGRILQHVRARGARLVLFMQNQLNRRIEQQALARLREFGAEHDVPVFDTWPFFGAHPPVSLMNDGFRDPHPNSRGHQVLAEGMARTLRAEGLVPIGRHGWSDPVTIERKRWTSSTQPADSNGAALVRTRKRTSLPLRATG
jgi:lysophospholipase L1-like esterase